MTLEKYLKKTRIEKGLQQAAVASKLGFSSPQYISNYERGLCTVSNNLFKKLSKILGVPVTTMIELRLKDERAYLCKKLGVK